MVKMFANNSFKVVFSRIFYDFNGNRSFASSSNLFGKKARSPYDKRFGIRPSDAGPLKPGGSKELASKLGRGPEMPQPAGIFDKAGKFYPIKEMIPEFVVPDLKNFKLKPYVSYRVTDITQSEFTAKDLFNATIAKDILDDYKDGKIDMKTAEKKIEALKSSVKN